MPDLERITSQIARLKDLSPEELTALTEAIDQDFDELAAMAEPSPTDTATMRQLVEAAKQVRAEAGEREAAKAAAAEEAASLKAEMATTRDPEAKPEGEAKPTETDEEKAAREKAEADAKAKEGETPAPEAGAPSGGPIGAEPSQVAASADPAAPAGGAPAAPAAPEPVVASAPRGALGGQISRMAMARRAEGAPEHGGSPEDAYRATIVAAAGIPHVVAGSEFEDPMALAEAMSERLQLLQRSRDHSAALVASAGWDYPEDRTLTDDQEANARKIDAVCNPRAPRFSRKTGDPLPLTASGGICLPVNVDYSVPTWVTADRPLRDALPAFQATRGGLRFVQPPDIGTVDLQGTAAGSGLATGVWTEATDASPGAATKPVWQVSCGTEELAYVNAVTTRVEFGNMQSRFAPEQVAANTEQAIAASAREAELELLTLLANSTNQVVPVQYLGAHRDVLATVDLLKAQYVYSHRLPENISLTAIFPSWAKDLFRADVAREIGHDDSGTAVRALPDSAIEEWFSVRGVEVVWTLDGLKAGTYGTGGGAITAQYFAKATAGAKPQWPGQSSDGSFMLVWFLFVTGTFQFLDGGRLDLGVVRDSVLDATNDYETFVETFEGLAFRGVEAYQVQQTVLPTGGTAGTVASTGYHE